MAVFARINYCKIRFVSVVGLPSTNMYPSYFIQVIPPSEIPYTVVTVTSFECLKGHGNDADFPRFLYKSVRHRSLTLRFAPFRFWLRIRGDIRNGKTTLRFGESGSRRFSDSASREVADSPTWQVGGCRKLSCTTHF